MRLTPTKSPVKLHRWTFEEDKAFIEFISIAKTEKRIQSMEKFLSKNGQHLVRTVSGMIVQNILSTVLPLTFSCQVMYGRVWSLGQRPIIYAQFHWTFALQFDRNMQT